jgi:arylsulfatase
MKGRKSDVYRGGVRVPFYFKHPYLDNTPNAISTSAANIDVFPTLAELCSISLPQDRKIDGQSLVPLMKDEAVDWEDRSLFFYWTRRYPELYSNMAIQKGAYKLVGNCDFNASITDFELYHLEDDPYELQNLVRDNEAIASKLKLEMENYYDELMNSKNIQNPPKVRIGTKYENPVILNRNDAGGSRGIWSQEEIFGSWDVHIEEGTYNVRFKFLNPVDGTGRMLLELGSKIYKQEFRGIGADMIVMEKLYLKEFIGELIPTYVEKGKRILPFWVELERVDL